VPEIGFGGAARGVLELAEEQQRRWQREVPIVALGEAHGQVSSNVLALQIAGLPYSIRALTAAVVKLRQIALENGIGLFHSHLLPADLVCALAAATLPNVSHVAHLRDTREWLKSKRSADVAKRLLYRFAFAIAGTRFVAVAPAVADLAQQAFCIHSGRMRIVLNGIDPKRVLTGDRATPPFAGKAVVVGSAGRFVLEKGHADLIQALSGLVDEFPELELRLAGQGSQRERLDRLGNSARLAAFEILENVQDMEAFYRDVDIFVLPSHGTEGLPRVMLEAMAAGCTTVATDVSGVRDVIRNWENGCMVAPGDPSALRSVLHDLLRQPDQARAMAKVGQAEVLQYFTVSRVTDDIIDLYKRCNNGHWQPL